MSQQDPENCAHKRHARELEKLRGHVAYFDKSGDEVEAAKYRALLKHTEDRLEHVAQAKPLVDSLGLSHEVNLTSVTYGDALNYVAKVLHEQQHGVRTERDFADDVITHLGLTAPEHIGAVNAFFGKAAE
jgi:uncharacterized protein (UPF0261 family)